MENFVSDMSSVRTQLVKEWAVGEIWASAYIVLRSKGGLGLQ